MSRLFRPRDKNGWCVPKEGTRSRAVYEMLKAGKSGVEIVNAFPDHKPETTRSLMDIIRNPDRRNAWLRSARSSRTPPRASARKTPFGVIEVSLESDNAKIVGRFTVKRDAQLEASRAHGLTKCIRFIYMDGRLVGAVASEPIHHETYRAAAIIAERAIEQQT